MQAGPLILCIFFSSVIGAGMVAELGKRFPLIPLVAEEDSAFVRSNNLVEPVLNAVLDKSSIGENPWTADEVLEAIDRGGPEGFAFGAQPATYWVCFRICICIIWLNLNVTKISALYVTLLLCCTELNISKISALYVTLLLCCTDLNITKIPALYVTLSELRLPRFGFVLVIMF